MSKKILSIVLLVSIAGGMALGLASCTSLSTASAAGLSTRSGMGIGPGRYGSGDSLIYQNTMDQMRGSGIGQGRGNGQRGQRRGGAGNAGQGIALGPLSQAESEALIRAIQEEYRVQALYQSVLDTFGAVIPFSNIVRSEAQHASVLVRLAQKYGVTPPEFPSSEGLPTFATLAEACQAGVDAEIADAALYDELIPVVAHADLLQVFTNLKNASLNHHLPQFEACK